MTYTKEYKCSVVEIVNNHLGGSTKADIIKSCMLSGICIRDRHFIRSDLWIDERITKIMCMRSLQPLTYLYESRLINASGFARKESETEIFKE